MDAPQSLPDLLALCRTSDKPELKKMVQPLVALQKMIGMTVVKEAIVRQCVFLLTLLGTLEKKKTSARLASKKRTPMPAPPPKRRRRNNTQLFANRAVLDVEDVSDSDESEAESVFDLDSDDTLSSTSFEEDDEDDDALQAVLERRALLGGHFMHLLIQGPPGVGKTTVAHIVYNIWAALGLVLPKKMFLVTKADLTSGYLGQSVKKTRALIDKAKGGVIAIDEAYALVSSADVDSYGVEVLAEIVNSMSNPADSAVFFFCGYKQAIEQNLFTANRGLKRRFGATFTLTLPNAKQMCEIFCFQLSEQKWKLSKKDAEKTQAFFAKQHSVFIKACGGSTLSLCRLAIEEAVLSQFPRVRRKIATYRNIETSFNVFKAQNETSSHSSPSHMYM